MTFPNSDLAQPLADARAFPDPDLLQPYIDAGWDLIPLHRWDSRSLSRGQWREDGKRPLHGNWTRRQYDTDDVVGHMLLDGRNVGVRPREDQFIIDIDPRGFPEGRNITAEFIEAMEIDLSDWRIVRTGGGGLHIYMRKPAGMAIVGSVLEFPGVEFKGKGSQCAAAGSRHPNGKPYRWDPDPLAPALSDIGVAPDKLLDMIKRPIPTRRAGGGEYEPEQIEEMLQHLDPCDFRDQDRWRELAMACHDASGGDARQEFIDWSTGDPKYADDAHIIGGRWDSFHRHRPGPRVTYRTLHHFMLDADQGAYVIPVVSAADDFDDDLFDGYDGENLRSPKPEDSIDKMNRVTCLINQGRTRIYQRKHDPALKRWCWVPSPKRDFLDEHENVVHHWAGKDRDKPVTVAQHWLKSPKRRKADGIVLDPANGTPGCLNLWQGWGVDPKPGDWSLMRELIKEVLCDGDPIRYEYVHKWVAHMFQFPTVLPEAALVFRGKEGTGKGTFANALMKLVGAHAMRITSPELIYGRFNSHLRDVIYLYADEAFSPTDRAGTSRLKGLITDEFTTYEGKGADAVRGLNMVHLVMTSNEDWVVKAGPDARRYFVSDVSDKWINDRVRFAAIKTQLENGGYEAWLHDMLNYPLDGWTPKGPPRTAALADQKIASMGIIDEFVYDMLVKGSLVAHCAGLGEAGTSNAGGYEFEWSLECTDVVHLAPKNKADLLLKANAYIHERHVRKVKVTHKSLLKALHKMGVVSKHNGNERIWVVPPLAECRANFEKAFGAKDMFDA